MYGTDCLHHQTVTDIFKRTEHHQNASIFGWEFNQLWPGIPSTQIANQSRVVNILDDVADNILWCYFIISFYLSCYLNYDDITNLLQAQKATHFDTNAIANIYDNNLVLPNLGNTIYDR